MDKQCPSEYGFDTQHPVANKCIVLIVNGLIVSWSMFHIKNNRMLSQKEASAHSGSFFHKIRSTGSNP